MSEGPERLEGFVAAILNARELVINLGRTHGVQAGMKFAVLSESVLEIRDPKSGTVLDTIDREKVRVEATEVRDKITICRTYRVKIIPGGPLANVYSGFATFTNLTLPDREEPETLSLQDASTPPPLSEEESYVKIKDRVIQITDE